MSKKAEAPFGYYQVRKIIGFAIPARGDLAIRKLFKTAFGLDYTVGGYLFYLTKYSKDNEWFFSKSVVQTRKPGRRC